MEALGYALGAIHQLGKPTTPDEEGHRDAPDDDYTDGEECYGDEYCVCGCNDEDDANCPSEEEEVAEPKGATEEFNEKYPHVRLPEYIEPPSEAWFAAVNELERQRKAAVKIQQAWRKYRAMKEEQARRRVLQSVVLLGKDVSKFEKSILTGTEEKTVTKVVFQGHKAWAWAGWYLLA